MITALSTKQRWAMRRTPVPASVTAFADVKHGAMLESQSSGSSWNTGTR